MTAVLLIARISPTNPAPGGATTARKDRFAPVSADDSERHDRNAIGERINAFAWVEHDEPLKLQVLERDAYGGVSTGPGCGQGCDGWPSGVRAVRALDHAGELYHEKRTASFRISWRYKLAISPPAFGPKTVSPPSRPRRPRTAPGADGHLGGFTSSEILPIRIELARRIGWLSRAVDVK